MTSVAAQSSPELLGILEEAGWVLENRHGVLGPLDVIEKDVEYLYVVELPQRNSTDESGDWTVKVSAHSGFTLWDRPTEEPFVRAAWEYEGSLSEAIAELVAAPA